MPRSLCRPIALGISFALLLTACGPTAQSTSSANGPPNNSVIVDGRALERGDEDAAGTSIWDAFRRGDEEVTVRVNKYLWAASLEVLNFLPVESVDPFTGVIITGFGTPPGGSRAYRATVLIDDPALNARSLNLSLQTRNAPADRATVRAVEDAILTRARQLRIADNEL